jgi:protein disulfide-isomerase A6
LLSAPKFDEFLSKKNDTAKAILFTNKGSIGALWKSLAIDFGDNIIFAQIRGSNKGPVEQFGITKFPTIVLLPGGDAEGMVYEGEMNKKALFDFFAATKPPKKTEEAESASTKPPNKNSFKVQAEKREFSP